MGRGTKRDNHDFFFYLFSWQINIFDYDTLFIPVHLAGHWALGVC